MRRIDWELTRRMTGIEADLVTLLEEDERRIGGDEAVRRAIERGLQAIARQDEEAVLRCIGEGAALAGSEREARFPLLFFAHALPVTLRLFSHLSVREPVISDTLADVGRWASVYARAHGGEFGLDRCRWLTRHFCAHLFQIGRMQYEPGLFEFPYTLYRRAEGGPLFCIADGGLKVTDDGYLAQGESGSRTTVCRDEGSRILANPVDLRTGTIVRTAQHYPTEGLERVFGKGDPVLHLHIPEGSPLSPQAVTDSLRSARTFFSDLQVGYRAIVCESWLLDPALDVILEGTGNICRFMHRFGKFPVPHETPQILERVFGPFSPVPSSSRLSKRLTLYLGQGGAVHTTGGFLEGESKNGPDA